MGARCYQFNADPVKLRRRALFDPSYHIRVVISGL